MEQIRITVPGIQKSLQRYDLRKALAEYIWNGFDAGANIVELIYEANELGGIESITIIDNGDGINYNRLDRTFRPFFESEKDFAMAVKRKMSAVHGKNGVGRLTFFTFAHHARWRTVFDNGEDLFEYFIDIDKSTLNEYSSTEPKPSTEAQTMTSVEFTEIHASITDYNFEIDITEFLIKCFGWFLELNIERDFNIFINGNSLDYSGIIGDTESFYPTEYDGNMQVEFDIRYVRWQERLIDEYSHYYFIGSDNIERFKETTTLNNKGDNFYHSVYIRSDYFDMLDSLGTSLNSADENQLALPGITRNDKIYKQLRDTIDRFLRDKRKPFLKEYSDRLIEQYEQDGVFPRHNGNSWDNLRHHDLENVVRELYQLEPRIFTGLNIEQKKTFVHLLNLIIDQAEKDSLLEVLSEIINLDSSELDELAKILRITKLSNIIKTIRLIEDRYKAIEDLKHLVFNTDLRANERDHLQKMIESHYWIFGEQYHLVTAAEPKFEEALRRHTYILRGEKRDAEINHTDKNKEMDIFMVRWLKSTDVINNVVVELKHPKNILLGMDQVNQLKKYMEVIQKTPEFNANNMMWEFYLVGNRFDTSGYIEREMENARNHGEKSLIYAVNQYKIYVKTWSEIFTEFELNHSFLLDRLYEEREVLSQEEGDANSIIARQNHNTAAMPSQFSIPEDGD